ncbi:MAG: polysaccharide deacetylase family protein [Microbacterium sp.]
MSRRRTLFAGLAIACVIGLTACAPAVDAAWTPPTWPATQTRVVDSAPAPIDPADVPGLTAQRLRNDVVGIDARFSYLPGGSAAVAPFNAAVDTLVRTAIEARAAATGAAYRPQVFPAGAGLAERGCGVGSTLQPARELIAATGTVIVCDLVAAGGPVLGERVRIVTATVDGAASDTSTIIYTDTSTGTVGTAEGVWTDAAAAALGDDVVEALRRDAGALSLTSPDAVGPDARDEAEVAAIRAALSSTVPTPEGTLVFTIPAGFTTQELSDLGVSETTEPMAIEVPADVAAGLVTDLGRAVLASGGASYSGPAGVPASQEWLDCRLVPCVALTYDDGPGALTPTLLDELGEAHVSATFFMLGASAQNRPDTVRQVSREGHEIGSHTWNHPQLPELDDAAIGRQLHDSRDILQQLSGQSVAMFRPPYGEYTDRVLEIAGIPAILWNVDTRDWAGPSDDRLLRTAVDGARPGGIILFHDIHENSVRIAPEVIAGLHDRGFSTATVTQLFGGVVPAIGAWRSAPQP